MFQANRMISRRFTLVLAAVISFAPCFSNAQTQQAPYTFHADTNVVLTDVTVTDARGNPIHGLPESAFHIFDNNHEQAIGSFEEHTTTPASPAALLEASSTAGVYSNDYLLHLPPVLNILLIDLATLSIGDQMYLNYELTRFLKEEPQGQPLAIYLRTDSGVFVVQNFTSDRKLLLDGLHKAIPRFPPLNPEYLTDFDALHEIALDLSELPGRKNVLWFSGGSALYLMPDAASLQNDGDWRALYDELDQERIAIYPIDARGLTVSGDLMAQGMQHSAMSGEARATGGEAFYNNNGFIEITEHLLDTDGSFYTLTYSPHNLRLDNKWHKVRVAVGGGSYHLSYRSGYFADGSLRGKDEPPKTRTRLLSNGEKLEVSEPSNHPIIFQASVLRASDPALAELDPASGTLPAPPPMKGTVPYSVRYTLPIDAFAVRTVDGKPEIVLGVAAIARSYNGYPAKRGADQMTVVLKDDVLRNGPHLPITLDQPLNLAKSDQYLSLSIWDTISGRFGSIQIPIEVPRHK